MGKFADGRELGEINNPQYMDINAACFMMLFEDLPLLLGAIIRACNRKIRLRNFEGFSDWLHVISDPVVVRVFAGEFNKLSNMFVLAIEYFLGFVLSPL